MSWLSDAVDFVSDNAGGILDAVGLGVQAYSQYEQGQDAKDVYEYNQAIAEYQAQYIRDAADLEIAALDRDVANFIGRKRAIVGKSGTVANIGSNLESIKSTYSERDIDAGLIRWRSDQDANLVEKGANLLGHRPISLQEPGP